MKERAEYLLHSHSAASSNEALRRAVERSLLNFHTQGLTLGQEAPELLHSYSAGDIDLLSLSFEMEALLEARS